jgi:hypothetical protein
MAALPRWSAEALLLSPPLHCSGRTAIRRHRPRDDVARWPCMVALTSATILDAHPFQVAAINSADDDGIAAHWRTSEPANKRTSERTNKRAKE